jgi:hypothetical protein
VSEAAQQLNDDPKPEKLVTMTQKKNEGEYL